VDAKVMEELLDELFSSLEAIETKSAATLQFLKDRDHVTDKDLASYLEQAGKASNVRWRAARLRLMSLLTSALKNVEPSAGKTEPKAKSAEPVKQDAPISEQSMDEPERNTPSPGPTASASQTSGEQPARDGGESPEAQRTAKPPTAPGAVSKTEKAATETPKQGRDSDPTAEQKPEKDPTAQKENAA
jgi:hypothetical protein